MITADKLANKYSNWSKLTSFEEWMPLRDHSLGACNSFIPVILLLMTAWLFAEANLSDVFPFSSPLRDAIQSENHRDAS